MKKLVIGILAHVDAGKTTLSEAMLYQCGSIRKLGRVDHKDALLDNFDLERERGITIFSKQARMQYENLELCLLDTPGHVDFSAEMERVLQVLDYAILVVSGLDGVQGHTQTVARLLEEYRIPTFIFVNKMDIAHKEREDLLMDIRQKLGDGAVDFQNPDSEEFFDQIAMCDEIAMEAFLKHGTVEKDRIIDLIAGRRVFPCFFGSALKLSGVTELLRGLKDYTRPMQYPGEFGARIYKISRDEQGNRISYLKVTGGSLKVKTFLESEQEKINQIRLYSGAKFESVDEVFAGDICAVVGLSHTRSGGGLGYEHVGNAAVLEPILRYQILLPEGCDPFPMYHKLLQLEEENPELHISWEEQLKEIHVSLMGEIQLEILKRVIADRFLVDVSFGIGNIVYKETLLEPVEGVGHFEPLRHYAEVHLLMEPLPQGSGLEFAAKVSEDELNLNWQRLILTHLAETEHRGVLTGSAITDMRITLVAGKSHLKHTEGGDFRQATYRAVRQGMKRGKSILLEPVYRFHIVVPAECVGRVMSDMERMGGSFAAPLQENGEAIFDGVVPVSELGNYMTQISGYTKGRGRMTLQVEGYRPCHNTEEVMEQIGYDSEADIAHPTGSVFCVQGTGFYVNWDEVEEHMHLPGYFENRKEQSDKAVNVPRKPQSSQAFDKELEEIMKREFGERKTRIYRETKTIHASGVDSGERYRRQSLKAPVEKYLLVDGYNIIFAWEELNELAKDNLDAARGTLMDILCNYQGFDDEKLILVFDAYKVKGNRGEVMKYHNIDVVFTKEAETADMYIEKVTKEIGHKHQVRVATSDGMEQVIILGHGAMRISAREFKQEVDQRIKDGRQQWNY